MSERSDVRFKCQQSGHCCIDPNIIVTLTFLDVYYLFLQTDRDFELLIRNLTFYKFVEHNLRNQRKKLVLPAIHTSDGEVIPGLKKINGINCTFYSKPNCTIYHNRPLACKNYPFTYLGNLPDVGFSWATGAKKTCPGIGKGSNITKSFIEKERINTIRCIELHNNLVQELNSEAVIGKPLSIREIIWIFIAYGEKIIGTQDL